MQFVSLLWLWTGTAMADSPLPPEGSVCESSLELDRDAIELPVYRVYTVDQLRKSFSQGAQFKMDHSPMDAPTPRPASKEVWMVLHSHEGGLSIQMEQGGDGPMPGSSTVWEGSWDDWLERWTFDVNQIQVSDATCMLDGKPVEGVQIKEQVTDSLLAREWVHCFAKERALPPVSTQIFDHGKKSGMSELVSVNEK